MQKKIISIKKGIKYLSEIEGFELPNGILNKEVTGCGATTIALTDKHPTIICSPRNELLKNKNSQYPNALLVIGGVHKKEIEDYIKQATIPKILVSYDSFQKIGECIPNKKPWRVVVDEFHYILGDASFKSEVNLRLLDSLKEYPHITYLSATPILDQFIEQLDVLKGVVYYQLKWEEKETVEVIREKSPTPMAAGVGIVSMYKRGDYPVLLVDGKQVYSKECIIFLNSVTNILNIIKQCELSPEEVNIIVGASEDNNKLIKELGEGFNKGRIPLRGEKHKMFTFCTSTSYAGCDFYSECASTFVISDNRKLNTTIDIGTDLVQIAGRQRLESNPFRKRLYFIYNTGIEDIDDTTFEQYMRKKTDLTKEEIEECNKASHLLRPKKIDDIVKLQKIDKYSKSYTMYDSNTDTFRFNDLAKLNEEYCYKVQKHGYENGIMVKRQLEDSGFKIISKQEWKVYDTQLKQAIVKGSFKEKMEEYCLHKESNSMPDKLIIASMRSADPSLEVYYSTLGASKIKALNFKESKLKIECENILLKNKVFPILKEELESKDFIPAKEAKAILEKIYKQVGITSTAKGSDLKYWYNINDTSRYIDGIKTKGYEILSTMY